MSLLLSEHVIEDDFVKSNGDMATSDVEMMGNVLERYVNKINLLVEANKNFLRSWLIKICRQYNSVSFRKADTRNLGHPYKS